MNEKIDAAIGMYLIAIMLRIFGIIDFSWFIMTIPVFIVALVVFCYIIGTMVITAINIWKEDEEEKY